MKKRLLSLLLTACMVLSLFPATALAAENPGPTIGEETPGIETPVADTDTDILLDTTEEDPAIETLATSTGIWVGTTEVTDANAGAITGTGITGTVTYDSGTDTLTLNNATITSIQPPDQNGNAYGNTGGIFRNSGNINIKLVGTNSVDISTAVDHYRPRGICVLDGNITITGDSLTDTLTVTGAPTSDYSFGISASGYSEGKGEVTIEGCTVTATAGDSTSTEPRGNPCNGINGSKKVTIQDATVTAIGGVSPTLSGGITAYGNSGLTIINSTVTAHSAAADTTAASTALAGEIAPILTGVAATASTAADGTGAVPYVYADNATYKWFHTEPKADDVAELTTADGAVTTYDTVGKAFAAAASTGGTIKR